METRVKRTFGAHDRWRHFALLISLLLLFIASAVVVTLRFDVVFLNVAAAVVLLTGTYAVSERKRLFVVTVIFAVVSVSTSFLLFVLPGKWSAIAAQGSVLVLLGLFSVSILGYVLRAGRITADKIYAAICVCLLIGYASAIAYAILEALHPGSFSISLDAGTTKEHIERVMQLRYFSFTTLTTVGCGDIVPRSPAARTIAMLEAMTGQIYLAVLVARLVGLHIVHANGPRSRDEK